MDFTVKNFLLAFWAILPKSHLKIYSVRKILYMNDSISNKSQMSFNTQQSQTINYKISTTGITQIELYLIKSILPENIDLVDLTPCTDYLIIPKMKYNDKTLAALNWKIPIIGIDWIYNTNENINNYLLKPFQGMVFTFLNSLKDKNEEIRIKNFFVLQGGVYQTKVCSYTNFVITDNNESINPEEYTTKQNNNETNNKDLENTETRKNEAFDKKQCENMEIIKKYQIPLIPLGSVYLNRFNLFKQTETLNILIEKIERRFFIDQTLDKFLYNNLKKHIIKLKGKRVTDIKDSDYILTNNFTNYDKKKYNCLNYNYIFDCSENNGFLYTEKYKLYDIIHEEVFKHYIFSIDIQGINLLRKEEIRNKIIALSGTVLFLNNENINKKIKFSNQKNITHVISLTQKGIQRSIRFVDINWLDSVLLELKIKREKISFTSIEGSMKENSENKISYVKPKKLFFQFSAINNKHKCINKLNQLNYEFIDANVFDERCTHLIIDKPITSEKLTCAVINGLILIKSDWAEKMEYNLNDFKWKYNTNNTKLTNTIISAIKHWRQQITLFNKKPFDGWIVEIEDIKLKEKFSKILEFGGAKMHESGPFTHKFVKKEEIKNHSNNVKDINFIFHTLFKIV